MILCSVNIKISTSAAGAVEATFHWSGHIREITKGDSKFSRFLTSIDKISPPGLTVKKLQIVRTLLHKIIHIKNKCIVTY